MAAWITDAELKEYIVAILGKSGLDTASVANWDVLIDKARDFAQNEVTSALVSQGFTVDQARDWDRSREFQFDLGAWHALTRANADQQYNQERIDKLDRREELQSVAVLIDGETPEVETGGIAFGMLSNPNDVFSLDMPD